MKRRRVFGSLILFSALGAFFFSGCGKNNGNRGIFGSKTSGISGTWYEQSESGGILTLTEDEISYDYNDYVVSSSYHVKNNKDGFEILPVDNSWYYPDIRYYKKEDKITMHTMPHTDGDGGYHLLTFLRTEYVAPPPVSYGERVDNSDASAAKSFSVHDVAELSLAVYEPNRAMGDMAPPEPREGAYEYKITRNDDGSALIDYAPCPERVELTPADMKELAELLKNSRLDSLNGVDVWTADTPKSTTRYELDISFTDGSSYHSRANFDDVSDVWLEDGFLLHQFIYEKLTDAGFRYWDNSFHSTKPMLRLGPGGDAKPAYSIKAEEMSEEKKGTAYDYKVSTSYTTYYAEGNAPTALMDTLEAFSADYRKLAEQTILDDDAIMAAAPKSVWGKEDRRSAWSFYVSEQEKLDTMFYSFYYSEGRANTLGLPPAEHGKYYHYRVTIDVQSGKVLSAADLFSDATQVKEQMKQRVLDFYSAPKYGLDLDHFDEEFEKAFSTPACEGGLDFLILEDKVTLIYQKPEDGKHEKLWTSLDFFYDDLQDVLSSEYAVVR
ncbi:MAG: hypothetical protein K6E50_05520 [Lachnospiraceae bacterium]|nr:hypothetical protein [Lachnospiraceae bacterium]